jgi:folate-binding protein YgfZ
VFGDWLGVPVVHDFGDVAAEHQAVSAGLAIADHSARGTVVATGADVVPLLQGIVTSDVFALAEPGSGQRSCAVNSKGRLVCDLRLLHGPEILVMDFEPGMVEDGVVSHFRANVMSEDAQFTDRSPNTSIIGVYGPKASDAMIDLGSFEHPPDSLAIHCGTWGTIGEVGAIVRRTELGFELLLDLDDAVAAWGVLSDAGAVPVGNAVLEVLRVEGGSARWGAELDEKVIPLEAGLDDTISFDKGCYVGQEIIARLDTLGRPARLLRKMVLSEAPSVGADVFDGAKKIGVVRTVVNSPRDGHLALAYLKRDHNAVGAEVSIGESRVAATIEEL